MNAIRLAAATSGVIVVALLAVTAASGKPPERKPIARMPALAAAFTSQIESPTTKMASGPSGASFCKPHDQNRR